MDANALINDAITVLASRPVVFSIQDVADYADLDNASDAIADALQQQYQCHALLPLDEWKGCGAQSRHYLGRDHAEHWWVNSTLRWARAGVLQLPASKLASEMSLTFDVQQRSVVPHHLLTVGKQFFMVTDGNQTDTFVFPWVAVIRASSITKKWFIDCINHIRSPMSTDKPAHCLPKITFDESAEQILATLTEREANVLRGRLGLENGQIVTLEQIGRKYGVSRERIRQIEKKTTVKLRHFSYRQKLWSLFAADFVKSGGSLLVPGNEMTPWREYFNDIIGLKTSHISQLGFHFVGRDDDFAPYRKALTESDWQESVTRCLINLSHQDSALVREAEKGYRKAQVEKTRAGMIREALRSLGRAAHFEEIAQECHRLFPGKKTSTHSWHAALSGCAHPDREQFGIVWIGVKGTYGLKEHGYSRPDADLFTQVADIVKRIYSQTNKPVSETTVLPELSSLRREFNVASVKIALSINERLEAVPGGFMPKGSSSTGSSDAETPSYDIDAAFEAFMDHINPDEEDV